ncbi:MAG: 3-phosphoshikimate 1-carboxyvinyltransferase [Myxococcales bacterium]|nr:3-phosphoshikimate 1-carboxyvinyltransferase [Myxococcales bacterium]
MDVREIVPLAQAPDATIRVPGSKSYTNRALALAALARGRSVLRGALFSDDTRYMAESLRGLGLAVEDDASACTFAVEGCDGRLGQAHASAYVGLAGTAARFLPGIMALGTGEYELDGNARMRQRPLSPLLDALTELGADVRYLGEPGCLPIRIRGTGLSGGCISMRGDQSSQLISGLLISAPYMGEGLTLQVEGELVSRPYVEMTRRAMSTFGAEVEITDEGAYRVAPGQRYAGQDYAVEPDASAASYFFAAAAICGGRVRIEGLGSDSLQGDLELVHALERMGCRVQQDASSTELWGPADGVLCGLEIDMSQISDTAQTLAVVAPFACSPTRITGIGFIRRKETDRVGAVVRELGRLGIDAVEEEDGLVIQPGTPQPGQVETYDDHRMAMAFALLGLREPGIRIADPGCTSKTFPDYWDVLDQLRA